MRGKTMGAALCAGLALSAGIARAADYDQNFDGVWKGIINIIDPDLYNPMKMSAEAHAFKTLELALEIQGSDARVFLKADEGWEEVKPGAFAAASLKTNAIVVAIDSNIAEDESIGWVETWNLTMTHKDDDTLYAYWVRSVNNYNVPALSDPSARFFFSGFGEMEKSDAVSGPGRFSVSDPKRDEPCSPREAVCGAGEPMNLFPHR